MPEATGGGKMRTHWETQKAANPKGPFVLFIGTLKLLSGDFESGERVWLRSKLM